MAPRAYWKGSLKLSLVTCPIALYPAALVKRKAAGKTIEVSEEKEEESNVIDLMEALKQSLGRKKAVASPSTKGKKRTPARRSRKRKAA